MFRQTYIFSRAETEFRHAIGYPNSVWTPAKAQSFSKDQTCFRDSWKVGFIGLLFAVISLACGGQAGLVTPPAAIPVSETAAQRLKQNAYQAWQEATTTYEAQLRLTDEEVTSLVAVTLTRTGQLPLNKPQIWFSQDQIHVTGTVRGLAAWEFNLYLTAVPILENGRLRIEVAETHVGPIGLSETVTTSLTQTINEALVDTAPEIIITQVEILEGQMIIEGKRVGE